MGEAFFSAAIENWDAAKAPAPTVVDWEMKLRRVQARSSFMAAYLLVVAWLWEREPRIQNRFIRTSNLLARGKTSTQVDFQAT